ncbi:unnamed protein product [Ranitomeya imitator]|uniref:DDE Tnp4 domain-containing protein n=1 Tax=Ranitomeya imitator TaxID=111125 RepID=A0ABN9L0P4_9NEOB|nr:unnamed protein product [Ranitomeya imitator]
MLVEEPRQEKRLWVHPLLLLRGAYGHFQKLYMELCKYPLKFVAFCHLSISGFDTIQFPSYYVIWVDDYTPNYDFVNRFLATGNSYSSLHFEFLLDTSTIFGIVCSTCDLTWDKLKRCFMPHPSTQDSVRIAQGFMEATEIPNCIGALDGKHIHVKKPPNSGSRYFNLKKYFSVVLLAVADSNYCFVIAVIGAYGSASDARASSPPATFIMVADEGFALLRHVLRSFLSHGLDTHRQIFYIRLMKARRRLVECAFGIFTSICHIFDIQFHMHPDNVQAVIKAAIILHNFCRKQEASLNAAEDGRVLIVPLAEDTQQAPQIAESGLQVRNFFADYFLIQEDSVPWQMEVTN